MKSDKPRIVAPATELEPIQRYCTCCKKPLKGRIAWLELDQRTDKYHDFGGVPVGQSQGWFPFGLTCARNKLVEARDLREAEQLHDVLTVSGGIV